MSDTTIALPGQIATFTDTFMLALAVYREARGEPMPGKIAVGCVIRNRVLRGGWFGQGWFGVITKPSQFSSFNLADHNSIVFGSDADPAWHDSIAAALRVMASEPDPTGGATFYFDRSRDANPPNWASAYVHTADIGAFHFYSENRLRSAL